MFTGINFYYKLGKEQKGPTLFFSMLGVFKEFICSPVEPDTACKKSDKSQKCKETETASGGFCGSWGKTQQKQGRIRGTVGLCTKSGAYQEQNKPEILEYKPGHL